jgi:hypothetical protein
MAAKAAVGILGGMLAAGADPAGAPATGDAGAVWATAVWVIAKAASPANDAHVTDAHRPRTVLIFFPRFRLLDDENRKTKDF